LVVFDCGRFLVSLARGICTFAHPGAAVEYTVRGLAHVVSAVVKSLSFFHPLVGVAVQVCFGVLRPYIRLKEKVHKWPLRRRVITTDSTR